MGAADVVLGVSLGLFAVVVLAGLLGLRTPVTDGRRARRRT